MGQKDQDKYYVAKCHLFFYQLVTLNYPLTHLWYTSDNCDSCDSCDSSDSNDSSDSSDHSDRSDSSDSSNSSDSESSDSKKILKKVFD